MGLPRILFNYAIKRLQKKACMILEHTSTQIQPAQEAVPINLFQLDAISKSNTTSDISGTAAAIRINCHPLSLEKSKMKFLMLWDTLC